MEVPGSQLVTNRVADILFIQTIRAYLASGTSTKLGWLRALSDQQIGAALSAMHAGIDQPWTVASLATAAGMSRSAFALRFKELVGESPLEYLTRWRMYRAGRLLRESDRKLIDVAKLVGYDSDVAFHKAFKRIQGYSPGAYRKNGALRQAAGAA
jgi:transcriptional regulator GlxA family with amidase domain